MVIWAFILIYHTYSYYSKYNIVLSVQYEELKPDTVCDKSVMSILMERITKTSELKSINKVEMILGISSSNYV